MTIIRDTKFYAGHRNQELHDKCFRPHGHTYYVQLHFLAVRVGTEAVTRLFSSYEDSIEAVRAKLDHRFLFDRHDPLAEYLQGFPGGLGLTLLNYPTSVENLAYTLFGQISDLEPSLIRLVLRETTTSSIEYTSADFKRDVPRLPRWDLDVLACPH